MLFLISSKNKEIKILTNINIVKYFYINLKIDN